MCNTVQLGPVPALSQVLSMGARSLGQGLEVRCIEMGNGGEGKPIQYSACVGAEAIGERVESSLFLSLQGQLHRSCLLTSIALWPFAQSLRFDFSSSFSPSSCPSQELVRRVRSFLIMVKCQPSSPPLLPACLPFFKSLDFISLITLCSSKSFFFSFLF